MWRFPVARPPDICTYVSSNIYVQQNVLWSIYIFIYHIYIWYSWWMMESIEEYSYRRRLLVDQLAGDLGWSWSPTSYALRSRQGQNRMCFHFRYLSSNLTWRNGDITQVSLNKRQKVRIAHGPAFVAYGLYYTSIMHTIYLEKSRWCQTPLSQRAVETPGLLTIYLPVVPNLEAAGGGEDAMLLVLNLFHFLGRIVWL